MKRAEARRLRVLLLVCAMAALVLGACSAEPPGPAQAAPVNVLQPAAFVQLPLPVAAYALSQQPALGDLRLVDVRGERVPHAWLPDIPAPAEDRERPVTLYPLPPRSAAGAELGSPLEVQVQAGRVTVRPIGSASRSAAGSPGWLLDLGERPAAGSADAVSAPRALRLHWAGSAPFSVTCELDTSDDLRRWRPLGGGPLMSLAGAAGPLEQRELLLPADTARFVRLVWRDPAGAPLLSAAAALHPVPAGPARPAPTELRLPALPSPPGSAAPTDSPAVGALHFDLGAVLPVVSIQLALPPGTRVAPVRLQGRRGTDGPWSELGSAVFYRLQREGAVSESPPLAVSAPLRQLRVLPDARAAALDAQATTLRVQAQLVTLVFAMQGTPPYRVQTGAPPGGLPPSDAGALPIHTLVPDLAAERARLGRAELGAFAEQPDALRAQQAAARQAALRPWLLWSVLLAGVGALGFMVWRLLRPRPAP